MSKLVFFRPRQSAHRRRRQETDAQVFVQEFEDYLRCKKHALADVPKHAPGEIARLAYCASRGGRDWLVVNPADLLCAAMPPRWSLGASDRALALVLRFNEFLSRSRRLTEQDAAFLEGWMRAAQVVVLKVLLRGHPAPDGTTG